MSNLSKLAFIRIDRFNNIRSKQNCSPRIRTCRLSSTVVSRPVENNKTPVWIAVEVHNRAKVSRFEWSVIRASSL